MDIDNFKKDLETLINKYNIESGSDTPDFVLTEYIVNCINSFNSIIRNRDKWYDFNPHKKNIIDESERNKNKPGIINLNLTGMKEFNKILDIIRDLNNNKDIPKYVKDKLYDDLVNIFDCGGLDK